MAPATSPSLNPCARPMPMRAMPMVAMVVQDEPVITLTSAQITQDEARKMSGWMICSP